MNFSKGRIAQVQKGLYIGNTRGAYHESALEKVGMRRILFIGSTRKSDKLPISRPVEFKRLQARTDAFADPGQKFLCEVLPWIHDAEEKEEPIIIADTCGVHLAPAATIAYLVWKGMRFEAARSIVAHVHPITAPSALVMESFLRCIKQPLPSDYEQWLHERRQALVK